MRTATVSSPALVAIGMRSLFFMDGYCVLCTIEDLGEPVFTFSLYLPDELTANAVRDKFVADGDSIFGAMLGLLTGNR